MKKLAEIIGWVVIGGFLLLIVLPAVCGALARFQSAGQAAPPAANDIERLAQSHQQLAGNVATLAGETATTLEDHEKRIKNLELPSPPAPTPISTPVPSKPPLSRDEALWRSFQKQWHPEGQR